MSKIYAFYNENDAYAAQWLRNLIKAGHITDGVVDDRSIEDITPDDLKGFRRVHLFAGIGVWDYALNRAGWTDSEVWSGSCPCQPFSVAGKGLGFADERHLWPAMHWLVQQRRPITVFGEQVASKDGYTWLDTVSLDLEGTGYTVGAVVAPAAGFGAPHQRHRMYWVADTNHERWTGQHTLLQREEPGRDSENSLEVARRGEAGGLADTADFGQYRRGSSEAGNGGASRIELERFCNASGLADTDSRERDGFANGEGRIAYGQKTGREQSDGKPECSGTNGFWSDAEWIYCRDEKYRPVESGTFPLVNGATSRVGRLRAYGNAICAPQAEEFIKAYLETRP